MATLQQIRDRVISEETAQAVLAPHLDGIQRACLLGMECWRQFADTMPQLRFPLTSRTVAGFINDWVVQHARAEFPTDPGKGVEPFEERGLFGIGFSRKILLRFKKADEGDLTRNYPTRQQQDLGAQQLVISGWEEATWLSACYHITPTAEAIDRIVITCRFSDYLLWAIPVYDARATTDTDVIPFPEPQAAQQRRSRVRPKNLTTPEGE